MALSHKKLAQKRHQKNLKRKGKKYTPPMTLADFAKRYDTQLKAKASDSDTLDLT